MDVPETLYAKTRDGVHIAYQALGDGPIDLAWITGFSGNLDLFWQHPLPATFYGRLAGLSRLILHDRRSTGLSDRADRLPDLETRSDDLRTVLDEVGSSRTVLAGAGEGAALAALFASTDPDRTQALVMFAP